MQAILIHEVLGAGQSCLMRYALHMVPFLCTIESTGLIDYALTLQAWRLVRDLILREDSILPGKRVEQACSLIARISKTNGFDISS